MRVFKRSEYDTDIEEFFADIGVELEAHERSVRDRLPRWYVTAPGVEIKEGNFLRSVAGNGDNIALAVADLGRLLAGQRIVLSAFTNSRREVNCPNEWR